jgi:hypothetical protein
MKNSYEVKDGVVYMDVSTKKHPGAVTTFDEEFLPKVSAYSGRWCASQSRNIVYVVINTKKVEGKPTQVKLHRLILETNTKEIDHKNDDGLDNRLCNLEGVTTRENQIRTKRTWSNNSTGVRGVTIDYSSHAPKDRPFRTGIKNYGKAIHIGYFHTLEEAEAARKTAESVYWGGGNVTGEQYQAHH